MKKLILRLVTFSLLIPGGWLCADLVAWYPLDEDADDYSGNGYHGAVVGGAVAFGASGATANTGFSADFSGSQGHIDVAYAAALNPGVSGANGSGSFSVSFWAYATAAGGATFRSAVTSRDDVPSTSVHGYILYNNSGGNWSFWSGNAGASGTWNQVNNGAVALNTWTHLAITYDASTQTKSLFVNGVSTSTLAGISANGPQMEALHIGSGQDNGANFYWEGRLDDVAVFNTALSPAEVQDIIVNGISTVPEPSSMALFLLGFFALCRRARLFR